MKKKISWADSLVLAKHLHRKGMGSYHPMAIEWMSWKESESVCIVWGMGMGPTTHLWALITPCVAVQYWLQTRGVHINREDMLLCILCSLHHLLTIFASLWEWREAFLSIECLTWLPPNLDRDLAIRKTDIDNFRCCM